jgi:ADP-ribose pyrophosphatase YjhB (NUDIX family)
MQLRTAGLLVIKNRKLLLAYSNHKQCYYLPGGKITPGETSTTALCREIEEELNVIVCKEDLQYYTHITAPAYGEPEGIIMEQDCFMIHQPINPIATAEIGALQYFSLQQYLKEKNTAPGAVQILQQLKAEGYID